LLTNLRSISIERRPGNQAACVVFGMTTRADNATSICVGATGGIAVDPSATTSQGCFSSTLKRTM
jgi:hypothetical protein